MKSNNKETLLCAFGGLGEVGKNMYVVMHENELFIIDCGVMFPEDNLMGIDYVLADFNQLKKLIFISLINFFNLFLTTHIWL